MSEAHHSPQAIPFFCDLTGNQPFAWQRRLFDEFLSGRVPATLDIPTGLGKTTAALLYLLAIARGAPLPRRLVYVVDRRAIVDQTVMSIRFWTQRIGEVPELRRRFDDLAAFSSDEPVLTGVLRGGFADDGEWRLDPARPAVVVGTVDMVGSRLLFSGYGDGLSRRAQHAGLLGHDVTLMLDEAHLSRGFEGLVSEVAKLQDTGNRRGFATCSLSATSAPTGAVFALDEDDRADPVVASRLKAVKRLHLHQADTAAQRLDTIVDLAADIETGSVLVYLRSVADARRVAQKLAKRLGPDGADQMRLLTGTLRGAERETLAQSHVWSTFLPGRRPLPGRSYLISTSAGEVGIDLDADHAVMDLATFDSLTQRLGRINRTGGREAEVHVVFTERESREVEVPAPGKSGKKGLSAVQQVDLALNASLRLLHELEEVSPAALRSTDPTARQAASSPGVTPVPLNPQTVEVFAATTALPRTPPLDLFLRGISDQPELPDTHLLWRWDVPDLVQAGVGMAAEALGLFRPVPRELARVSTREATEILEAAVARAGLLTVIVRNVAGQLLLLTLTPDAALPDLRYATVYLPVAAGGLTRQGLPDPDSAIEVKDLADDDGRARFMVTHEEVARGAPPWSRDAVEVRVSLHDMEDDEAEPRWLVYSVRRFDPTVQDADSDVTRLAAAPQTVEEHLSRVGAAARRIAEALKLEQDLLDALETAGAWHDAGKARHVWQRAAGIPSSGPAMAKARKGRFSPRVLDGYRHEFGSLADAERGLAVASSLDLALHLIAAHHGRARPGFPDPRHWDRDLPADMGRKVAIAVARRFGRLQAQYGPWRLAWLEALLKAADAWVSAGRDEPGDDHG